MLEVVSVSLGSSSRDTDQEVEILGRAVHLRRLGVGGDLAKAEALIGELDGKVDAIGLGGIDLYLKIRERRFYLRDAVRLARAAERTPVVCGAGLKDSLERLAVRSLAPRLGLEERSVLMVSAADRFGMAEELASAAREVTFGDLIFALGLPLPLRRLRTLEAVAHLMLPVITRVPFTWLYPVGAAQEREPQGEKFARYYRGADLIAGDWHYIKRYAPADLSGKTILTNTTTPADVEFLRERGARSLITTTPRFGGRSVGTNLLEASFIAIEGAGGELGSERYRELVKAAGIEPTVLELTPSAAADVPGGARAAEPDGAAATDAKIVPS